MAQANPSTATPVIQTNLLEDTPFPAVATPAETGRCSLDFCCDSTVAGLDEFESFAIAGDVASDWAGDFVTIGAFGGVAGLSIEFWTVSVGLSTFRSNIVASFAEFGGGF